MPTVGVQHAAALWLAMLAGSGGHERRRERTASVYTCCGSEPPK